VTGRRPERLAEEIREEVARMVASELKDPRIGFVTVTRVELTTDLRYARVHVGVLGSDADRDKTLSALRQAAGFVRREIGRRLRVRYAPEIDFRYDRGLEATDRVARILGDVGASEVAAPDGASATPSNGEPPADGRKGG
jgi:ribosome-binding factor A